MTGIRISPPSNPPYSHTILITIEDDSYPRARVRDCLQPPECVENGECLYEAWVDEVSMEMVEGEVHVEVPVEFIWLEGDYPVAKIIEDSDMGGII